MKHHIQNTCILFLFFSFFYSQTAFGQARGLKYAKHKNSIDFVVGGDFGFRMIKGQSSDPEAIQQFNNRDEFEDYKLNYRFGFNYYHGLTSNLLFKTGIRLTNPGFQISSVNPIDPTQDINATDKSFLLNGYNYKYNYQLIEVPIGLRYIITKSFCNPYVELSVSPNFYWRTVVEESNPANGASRSVKVVENINTVNYFGTIATGGDFRISDQLSGFSQLVARYQLNNLREGELEERLIALGLEVGVRCHL